MYLTFYIMSFIPHTSLLSLPFIKTLYFFFCFFNLKTQNKQIIKKLTKASKIRPLEVRRDIRELCVSHLMMEHHGILRK